MSKRLLIAGVNLGAVCFLLMGLSSPAADQDTPAGDEAPSLPTDEVGYDVASILLAYQLADYGLKDETKSPLALVTAAKMLRSIHLQQLDAKNVLAADNDNPSAVDPFFLRSESDRLLNRALELAKSDSTIKELAARDKKSTWGVLKGPLTYTLRLQVGQTDTYKLRFRKGVGARVAIRNQGDGLLHLEVRNNRDSVRARDDGRHPSLSWDPQQRDGIDYKITVTNKGTQATTYTLFSN